MLELLFNSSVHDGLESYLTLQPSTSPLETNSKLEALRRDIERYENKIKNMQFKPIT